MQNMIDYLRWRGDLPFSLVPVCDADYLVFSQLAYIPYDSIVSSSPAPTITLGQAARKVLENLKKGEEKRLMFLAENISFLKEIVRSPRYSKLSVCAYATRFNVKKQQQFSAVTFLIPDHGKRGNTACVVAFRGTDASLVGWKEDFNMAFSKAVPSQLDAVRYLKAVAASYPSHELYVCGHSKGGNLAVYSSAFCGKEVQDNIAAVRNLDGPGFCEEVIKDEGFMRILDRVETILPSSSLVGILLEHTEEITVIRSNSKSIRFEHDPFTWEISRSGFVYVEKTTKISEYLDSTLSRWLASMSDEMREKLINGMYSVITSAGDDDIRNLFKPKGALVVLRGITKLDRETAKVMREAFYLFNSAAGNNLFKFVNKLIRASFEASAEKKNHR